ncbi:unnamed protein product, partial [Cyprideis torosa]
MNHRETYQAYINDIVAEEVDIRRATVAELNERINLLSLHLGYSEIFEFLLHKVSPAHVELLATEQAHVSSLVNKANRSLLYALHHLIESKEQEAPPAVPARTTYLSSVPARDGAPFQLPLSRSTPRPHDRSSEIPTTVTVEDISQVHATPVSFLQSPQLED